VVAGERHQTLAGELARQGFRETDRAASAIEVLSRQGLGQNQIKVVASAADPDLALSGLADLEPSLIKDLVEDLPWLARVTAVLGGSRGLGRHLIAQPSAVTALRGDSTEDVRSELWRAVSGSAEAKCFLPDLDGSLTDALKLANRDQLVRIAADDLLSDDPLSLLPAVTHRLSDLADAVVEVALALARSQVPGHNRVRFSVIALGKCGGRELNYFSDVDVIFIVEPADPDSTSAEEVVRRGSEIASALMQLTTTNSAAGAIWPLDAGLRPEGRDGPLVRTLAAMENYYSRHAATWEFQALMKARPMAGDMALGQQFCDLVRPLVWAAGGREGFVTESRAMRRRVVSLIPSDQIDREIKLSAGGLRDIEFTAQILQLVHGRVDERLRSANTLEALQALSEHGYIGRQDGQTQSRAYLFLRLLEHRQQLYHWRRTHLMPSEPDELRRLARSCRGLVVDSTRPSLSEPISGGQAGQKLWTVWRQTANLVQRLQQRVFYSALLEAVSKVSPGALRLSSTAAEERLVALSFADPAAALRHIAALTSGVSRTAEMTRQLMPAMLGWLAEGANPDAGLLAFRQVSEALGASPWYLKTLRDEGGTAEDLAHVMSSSRLAVDLLRRDPPSVELLKSGLEPRSHEDLKINFLNVVGRHSNPESAVASLRAGRRHELARIAVADVLGRLNIDQVGQALSDITAATLEAALALTSSIYPSAPPLGVVAMGRWGGWEMGFASDADVLFVAPNDAKEHQLAAAVEAVAAVRSWLTQPGPDPSLEIDARLRPEGQDGQLVRTVGAYMAYYQHWSWTWEAQALIRASHGAGEESITGALLNSLAPWRWPPNGLAEQDRRDIRALKRRLEEQRGGTSRATNLKLGPGGLIDIEWTIQLTQLGQAGSEPALRVTGTKAAILAAQAAGVIADDDASQLIETWVMVSRVRNAIIQVRGRASDLLPSDPRELTGVAMLMGYEKSATAVFVDDLSKAMRQAARVTERLFWGR